MAYAYGGCTGAGVGGTEAREWHAGEIAEGALKRVGAADRLLNAPRWWQHTGMTSVLAYVAAALVALWGVAHAIPTRQVVAGFAPIEPDNRRIVIQEWLAEASTMWGLAAIVVAATLAGSETSVAAWVYRAGAGLLLGLAVLTAATGARTAVIWFKICPVLLTTSAVLLLTASFL